MKKIIWPILILVLALMFNGCAKKETKELIGIRGEIKELYLSEDGNNIDGFLVEGEIQEDTMYDSADVTIDENTTIYIGEEEGTIEDLEEGLKVEVIFEGPVAESYPVQGVAKEIYILAEQR